MDHACSIIKTISKGIRIMSPIAEINQLSRHLPLFALQDIQQRITDWLAMGGNENDPYIEQQLRYAKRFVGEETKCQKKS